MSDSPIESFTFSMQLAQQTKKDLTQKVEALSDRIDKIVDHFTINDMPIVRAILQVTHSRQDLKKLAKALDRVAEIIELHDSMTNKLKVIELAEQDPYWFASAFGDFEKDIDTAIANLLTEE